MAALKGLWSSELDRSVPSTDAQLIFWRSRISIKFYSFSNRPWNTSLSHFFRYRLFQTHTWTCKKIASCMDKWAFVFANQHGDGHLCVDSFPLQRFPRSHFPHGCLSMCGGSISFVSWSLWRLHSPRKNQRKLTNFLPLWNTFRIMFGQVLIPSLLFASLCFAALICFVLKL